VGAIPDDIKKLHTILINSTYFLKLLGVQLPALGIM
jgi:hypothetical protein